MSTHLTSNFRHMARLLEDYPASDVTAAIGDLPTPIQPGSGADEFRQAIMDSGVPEYIAALEAKYA